MCCMIVDVQNWRFYWNSSLAHLGHRFDAALVNTANAGVDPCALLEHSVACAAVLASSLRNLDSIPCSHKHCPESLASTKRRIRSPHTQHRNAVVSIGLLSTGNEKSPGASGAPKVSYLHAGSLDIHNWAQDLGADPEAVKKSTTSVRNTRGMSL